MEEEMHLLRFGPRKPRVGGSPAEMVARVGDDVGTMITRGRFMGEKLTFGPNWVHVGVIRGPNSEEGIPNSVEDLGWFKNLKTYAGMDWLHNSMGGYLPAAQGGPATATTATSFTATSTPWTSNQLTGFRVVFPVTGITTAPVYGNILSNTTSVAQVDQWWTAADGVGTTPASTNAFHILVGQGPARFIGLSNTGSPAVGDTAMNTEVTANGMGRALATFAHTQGSQATTYTLTKTWTASGSQTVANAGNLTGGYGASGGGVLVAHTAFTSASLGSGDSLQLTWTWTLPAAG